MIQWMIRRPPVGYVFNEEDYRSDSPAKFGDKIRHFYPELSQWEGSSITQAWGDYNEATAGSTMFVKQTKRDEDFLAYLHAEQELRCRGLLIRGDGKPGRYYQLTGLRENWAVCDFLMEKEGNTANMGIDTPVDMTYPRP